jgi:hypothetical protein
MGETVRWWLVPLGVAAMFGAIIALNMPVSLSAADRTGLAITCGSAMREDLSTARHEDSLNQQLNVLVGPQYHPSDYASECESLIALKWRVALPVASLGGLVIAAVLAADVVSVRGRGRHRAEATVVTPALGFPSAPMGGAHP